MSHKNIMRRYLRQDKTRTSKDTSDQVGEIVFSLNKAFLTFDNGCKKVWTDENPVDNPGAYIWDCPDGFAPQIDSRGGDRGVDDDDYAYDDDDDDYGDTLIYECIDVNKCNDSNPSEPSADGWEFKGICDFGGGICPFERYSETGNYIKGDYVAVQVAKLLHECVNSDKCNANVPTASSNADMEGWKLIGGCEAGEECSAVEFDTSLAGRDGYNFGDEVFTKNGHSYGAIVRTGSSSGGGAFGGNSVGGTGGGSGEFGGGDISAQGVESRMGEINDFKGVYQCNDKSKCNEIRPAHLSAAGWDFVGANSSGTGGSASAPQFVETASYNLGDKVTVPVDKLIHECEDPNTCNGHVPGASTEEDGWKLVGSCRAGRICNVLEFNPARAAGGEYEGGDNVYTRIDYNYLMIGSIGGTTDNAGGYIGSVGGSDVGGLDVAGVGSGSGSGEGAGTGENGIVDSIFCPSSNRSDKSNKKLVTYSYEVETAQVTDSNAFLPGLEERILSYLSDTMLSACMKDERLRRRMEENGVSGIESFPMDVYVPGGLCDYNTEGADGCFAFDGGLTLSLDPEVDSEAAAEATRALLKEAMTNDALLSPDSPEVVKVKFLGESYDDYVVGIPGELGATGLPKDSTETGMVGSKKIPTALLLTFGLLSIMISICWFVKRRMSTESKEELDTQGEDSDLEDDLDDVINRINDIGDQPQTCFAVDPPGAFHMGAHHYTEDGVQYKSLSCAQCQTSNLAAGGILGRMITTQEDVSGMDLNDKNDLSFDLDLATNFIDFSRNDLGRTHSSINVRHCKSATCEICKKAAGVVFVKSQNSNEVEL